MGSRRTCVFCEMAALPPRAYMLRISDSPHWFVPTETAGDNQLQTAVQPSGISRLPARFPGHLHWNCMILTLAWTPDGVRFIDQTKLPLEESYVLATTYEEVADVIVTMVVRGAPAIGVSAAYGIALGALRTSAAT